MESRSKTLGISDGKQNDSYDADHMRRSEVRHVGFSLNKKNMPGIVKINSVWDKKFKMKDVAFFIILIIK